MAEQQEVVEVRRADLGPGLEDAVILGVDARMEDGMKQAYALVYARENQQMVLRAELPLRERLSSAREMGPEERLALYTMTITKKVGQLKEDMGPKIEEHYHRARLDPQAQEPSARR